MLRQFNSILISKTSTSRFHVAIGKFFLAKFSCLLSSLSLIYAFLFLMQRTYRCSDGEFKTAFAYSTMQVESQNPHSKNRTEHPLAYFVRVHPAGECQDGTHMCEFFVLLNKTFTSRALWQIPTHLQVYLCRVFPCLWTWCMWICAGKRTVQYLYVVASWDLLSYNRNPKH